MIKTEIRKTEKGHQVGFTIGVQTFFLKEQLPEDGMTSLVYAKWYEKQLKTAFQNLTSPVASKPLTSGDVERINKTPIWNFLDWLTVNDKIKKESLLWDHMNTYIKGVVNRFKKVEKVNGR